VPNPCLSFYWIVACADDDAGRLLMRLKLRVGEDRKMPKPAIRPLVEPNRYLPVLDVFST